jgi:aspartate/methionine/tyrosine aminotransferase
MDPGTAPDRPRAELRPAMAALPESGIVEMVNRGREVPGLIPLWVGEGDLPTPSFIAEAAGRALAEGQTFYTWQRGIPPLRSALARYLGRVHGADVAPERIFVTASGMQAIMLTLQAVLDPGTELVMTAPIWPNVFSALPILGAVPRFVPLTRGDDGWRLDPDRLFAACGPRTRAVFLNAPGNPTGWMMPRADMAAVRDFCRARGLWLIADEVYARIVFDAPAAPSFLEICDPEERLVVVNSFSKTWAMTGWRMGWVVAPAALGQVYENLIQYNTSGVATFLQHAAVTAVEEGEPFVAALVERCRAGRDLACETMAAWPRVEFARPEGAFYLFFSVAGEPDSRALALRLIEAAGVGLAPGTAFGPGGEGYLRLCFATSADRLSEALDRLAPVLA